MSWVSRAPVQHRWHRGLTMGTDLSEGLNHREDRGQSSLYSHSQHGHCQGSWQRFPLVLSAKTCHVFRLLRLTNSFWINLIFSRYANIFNYIIVKHSGPEAMLPKETSQMKSNHVDATSKILTLPLFSKFQEYFMVASGFNLHSPSSCDIK